ncbi:MAG: alpha-hydroxy-acid oxidizing protein [Rhodospirillaceae bacterium]|nr:alpha-hydroxy-acid oxidizing protein [Rhodospirillaceae bacterium]
MIVNIADMRRAARRRLPRFLFDYVDGAAYDEKTMRWNEAAFDRWRFRHRVLVDVTQRQLGVTVLGADQALPLALGPTGFAGLLWPRGEIAAAKAAEAAGIPFCLSTASICSIEEVRAAIKAPFWFQLYVTKDRGIARDLLSRADAAGCSALVLTVDIAMRTNRERDARNRFLTRSAVGLKSWADMMQHPAWCLNMLRAPKIRFGNLASNPAAGSGIMSQGEFVARNMDFSLNWKDLDWLRGQWKRKLIVKGVCHPDDAARVAAAGADAIVVSNHGGRQLDSDTATLDALPAVVERVGDQAEVLFDGGLRRGQSVVKALALGAKGCIIGRSFLYGLAAAGTPGVSRALDILKEEIDSTIGHIGVTDVRELAARREEFLYRI